MDLAHKKALLNLILSLAVIVFALSLVDLLDIDGGKAKTPVRPIMQDATMALRDAETLRWSYKVIFWQGEADRLANQSATLFEQKIDMYKCMGHSNCDQCKR